MSVWYVTPRALQWMVFTPGNGALKLESSRTHAIERAKSLARASGGGTVVVGRRDGTAERVLDAHVIARPED